MDYATGFLRETSQILDKLEVGAIEEMVRLLVATREKGGRLFILGVGGGAGHASHAVCDFRKIAGIETYSPCDNVSELTARTNDEGWETTFSAWLAGSRLSQGDIILVFSVGGGDLERNISPNLVRAVAYAREVGAKIIGVVGRDGGYTAKVADACVIVPTINAQNVTAQTESIQGLVWHLLISHPDLMAASMKWESTEPPADR